MADHAHRQIRDALSSALTGLTTSSTRVFANRLRAMQAADLPGLRIFAETEQAEAGTVHNPMLLVRSLDLRIECCAKAALANLDDTLDLMSKEVEIRLASGISVGGQTIVPIYTGMEMSLEQADQPLGIKALNYRVEFETFNNAPDVLA